jgi:FtsZ-interacting cell division protein YlmF
MANQTQTNNVQTQTQWKRIKVPANAFEFIKSRAQARKMPMWQLIVQAIDFYETSMSNKIVADKTKLQNASYYAIKLTMAVTEYIHKTNDRTYENARRIALQVRDRKHVNVDTLLQLIDMYRQRRKKSYVRAMTQELVRINIELMIGGSHE